MSRPENTGPEQPRARRWWVPVMAGLAVVAVLGGVLVAVLVVRSGGPSDQDARDVVEDYLAARIADGCGHLQFHSEDLAEQGPSLDECLEEEEYAEGEYFEYDVTRARVDGDRAEVEVEDNSDAHMGTFTVHLVVEDDEWRVDEIERHE